jgi:hypothetical protein
VEKKKITILKMLEKLKKASKKKTKLRQGSCGGGPFCDPPSSPQQYFPTKVPTEVQFLGSRPAEIHVFVNFALHEVCTTASLLRHYCSSTLRYVRQVLLPTKKIKFTSSWSLSTAGHGVWPLDFNNKNR